MPIYSTAVTAAVPTVPQGSTAWSSGPVLGGTAVPTSPFQFSSQVSRDALRMVEWLPPFLSDSSTPNKAKHFWASFEANTAVLPAQARLLAFYKCLKGETGKRWWSTSNIQDFGSLRVRFHNRFVSQTPEELWAKLNSLRRERGESVEEWGDRVSELCDCLNYHDAKMRYQLFCKGLRNKAIRALLRVSYVATIPQACEFLLLKEMHRPEEEEDEFVDERAHRVNPALEEMDKRILQMQNIMIAQQQQLEQQQQRLPQPRSPRNRGANVAAVSEGVHPPALTSRSTGYSSSGGARGVLQGPDQRTQEGAVICGRCLRVGHSRAVCSRQNGNCRNCGRQGHYGIECLEPRRNQGSGGGGYPQRNCFMCNEPGHFASQCPMIADMRAWKQSMTTGRVGGAPVPALPPSQP